MVKFWSYEQSSAWLEKLLLPNILEKLCKDEIKGLQKQPPEVFNKTICSKKFHKIHKCFSVNFVKHLRIPFLQNTSRFLDFILIEFLESWNSLVE